MGTITKRNVWNADRRMVEGDNNKKKEKKIKKKEGKKKPAEASNDVGADSSNAKREAACWSRRPRA